jgi:C-terminal processing protease CtpA/Prc
VNISNLKRLASLFLACFCCLSASSQQQQPLSTAQFTEDFDFMWSGLRDNYTYFDKKETDWNRVRQLYRPMLAEVKTRSEFVTLLERVLDELYDNHTSLNTNLKTSPRLVPTGLDVWAEWIRGRAIITQLRRGFSAEQSGLKPGMEIISIDGLPVKEAAARRLPKSLKAINDDARGRRWRVRMTGRE